MTYAEIDKMLNTTMQAQLTAGTLKACSIAFIVAVNKILTDKKIKSARVAIITKRINKETPAAKNILWWAKMIRRAMLSMVRSGQAHAVVSAYTMAFGVQQ